MLVLVLKLAPDDNGGYIPPTRPLNDYSLDELKASTDSYSARQRRQAAGLEVVYIAANVSEADLSGGGVAVGDGMVYGGYTNHPLEPGIFHIVGLRGVVAGATTPKYADSAPSTGISKWHI